LARCLLGLADQGPLLLCLDDLHWADPATLSWLAALPRWLAGSQYCVLATCRLADAPAVADVKRAFARPGLLAEALLSRLTTADIAAILAHTAQAPGAAQPLAARLHDATGGNAFFVLETVRALLESGGLADPPERLPLPSTVQAAIERRLERLSPSGRQALEAAAVLAPDLAFDLLAQTAGRSELEMAQGLDELEQRQLLADGDQRRFSHDLVREVVYDGLSPWRRRILHRRAAEALGEVYARSPEKVAAQRAQHYDAAGAYEQAVESYQLAASIARQLYAHEEAIAHLRRAIELSAETALETVMHSQLHESLADNLTITGRFIPAEETYRTALTQMPQTERLRRAELQRKIAETLLPQNRAEEAISLYRVALGSLMEGTDVAHKQARLGVLLGLLDALYWEYQTDAMVALKEQTRVLLDEVGTAVQQSQFYHRLEQMMLLRERYRVSAETVALARTSLAYAQQTGDAWHIARSQFGHGFKLLWYGDLDGAEDAFKLSLAAAEGIGDLWLQNQCLAYLTILYRLRGDVGQVNHYLPRLAEASEAVESIYYKAVTQANNAWLNYRDGKSQSAQELAQAALAIWGGSTYPFRWLAYWVLLAIALHEDRFEEAIEAARAMLDPKQQRLPDGLTIALEGAVRAWEEGKPEEAGEALQRAVELAQAARYL
jgi:hypothetical protein